MSEVFMNTRWPRDGVTYNSEKYALTGATEMVKQTGKSVEIWKRVALVEAEAKVTRD